MYQIKINYTFLFSKCVAIVDSGDWQFCDLGRLTGRLRRSLTALSNAF